MKGSTPLVCSKHNAEQFWPNRNRQISKLMSRFFSSRAFAIVAISQGVKVFLLTSAEVRPDSNIEVIHYGFDDSKPLEEVRLIPKRTSLRFLCVSRLTEQKDIPTLLKAFAAYNKQFKDSTLTIVGDGDLRHFLIELSEVLGIADSIKWVRHVLQIDELYKTHDCLVLTSKYEGFGMVLLEAMQSGLPILCSSNSTSKEVLGGSHPGLFEVGDFLKLSKLMSQTHKAEIYSQNSTLSRERIFAFDPNCSFEKMQRLYCRAKS
jgi:glycosyltransferase involved in cell wall biosynthesis